MSIDRNNRRASGRRRSGTNTTLTSRLLIATDGRRSADPAVRMGALLAHELGAEVGVASILESMPLALADIDLLDTEPTQLEALRHRVREQLRRQGADADVSRLHVRLGHPATAIVEMARKHRATMIVMGIGRHRPIDRLLGSELVLQVVRLTHVPVLAVASGLDHIPRRAMVAVDFSKSSIDAARAACQLVVRTGVVHLAHVRPAIQIPAPSEEGWETFYESGVARMFKELKRDVRQPRGARLDPMLLDGEIVPALLAFAREHEVDLLAVGAHHRSVVDRVLIGSVTARLVRGATCSVLIVPQSTIVARRSRAPRVRTVRLPAH